MDYIVTVTNEKGHKAVQFSINDLALDSGMSVKEILGYQLLNAIKEYKKLENEPASREIFS